MLPFVLRRVAIGLVTIWLTSIVTFLIIHNIPGDPIGVVLQQYATPEVRASLERFYGLDQPLHIQYVTWLQRVFQGDLGSSMLSGSAVSARLVERLPRSLYLMIGALIVSLVISLVAGAIAALRKGRVTDVVVTASALAFQSTPSFWLGILLILFFGVRLGWFPTAGYTAPSEGIGPFLQHLLLPAVASGGALAGLTTRTVRASLLNELKEDYILLARSTGAPFLARILPVHVMRNALAPIITLVGLQVGWLLSGSVIIETVFSYPGLGLLVIDAVLVRDYPVIQACILLFTVVFVVVNIAVDIAVMWLDPQSRRATVHLSKERYAVM